MLHTAEVPGSRSVSIPTEGTHLHLRNVLAGAGTAGIRPGDKRVWVKGIDETAQLPPVARCRRKLWSMINRCLLVDAHFLTVSPEHLARTVETSAVTTRYIFTVMPPPLRRLRGG